MGREVRRVPAGWSHPKEGRRYRSLYGGSFSADLAEWEAARTLFAQGKDRHGKPLTSTAADCSFEDWHGERPRAEDYMPDWPEAERTHFQMYETTSEGSPISPVFSTPEELARWLADTGASAFADMGMSYDEWLKVARGDGLTGALYTPSTGVMVPA